MGLTLTNNKANIMLKWVTVLSSSYVVHIFSTALWFNTLRPPVCLIKACDRTVVKSAS